MGTPGDGGGPSVCTRSMIDADDPEEGHSRWKREEKLVKRYGHVTGEDIGKTYSSRVEMRVIHRPASFWIHLGPEGPYSLIVQGNTRFLDEGRYIVILDKQAEDEEGTSMKKDRVFENLIQSLRARLPIRVLRVLKDGANSFYRYDGLYVVRKRMMIDEHPRHFILKRNKNQPPLGCIPKQSSNQVALILELKKKFSNNKKKPVLIKNEIEIKQEIPTTNTNDQPDCNIKDESESPSDYNNEPVTSPFDYNNEPVTSPSDYNNEPVTSPSDYNNEPVTSPSDYNNEPVTSPSDFNNEPVSSPSDFNNDCWLEENQFIKPDFENNDNVAETSETYLDQTVESLEMFEEVEENMEEEGNHESFEDVIIERIQVVKSENDDPGNDVTTILAIVPEGRTSEYVKESPDSCVDPLYDGDFHDNFSDEARNSDSDENKADSDAIEMSKKSNDFSNCENVKVCDREHQLVTCPTYNCLYNLTLAQILNAVSGTHELACPCKIPKCGSQQQFESSLKALIDERETERVSSKFIKDNDNSVVKPSDNFEGKGYYSVHKVFDQLTAMLGTMTTGELQVSESVKRSIVKKPRSTRKYRTKKVKEKALVPNENSLSSAPSVAVREDEEINIPRLFHFSEGSEQREINNVEPNVQPLKKRRKKRKGYESTLLGPMISPNNDDTPRSKKGRILTRRTVRCNRQLEVEEEEEEEEEKEEEEVEEEEEEEEEEEGEEGKFIGFKGPFRPPCKLRLIRSYIKKLPKS